MKYTSWILFMCLVFKHSVFFSQTGINNDLLKDQNPNYQKSKNKYVKKPDSEKKTEQENVSVKTDKPKDSIIINDVKTITEQQLLNTYLQKLEQAQKKNSPLEITQALLSIADYYKNNNATLALDYYQKALKLQVIQKNNLGTIETLNSIGNIYFKQKDYLKAEEYYTKSLKIAQNINNSEKVKIASDELSKLYVKQGNYKNAYEMHLLFKSITDSLYKEETKRVLQQNQLKEQYSQKRILDSLQDVQNKKNYQEKIETKQREVENTKRITYLISIGLLLACLLAFSFYKSYKNTKKSNNIISAQKLEAEERKNIIEKSLEEKEVLLKEIHHRVKNNLQIVSSLLNLQSNKTDSIELKKIMDEAKNRISSMALIHQKIYQSGNLTSIDFKGYIEQLVETIEKTFNNKTEITYHINTNNIILDMDTAVPLGLIVNELLTNIFKYAFVNKNKGIVNVSLSKKSDTELELHVSDNGEGLSNDFDVFTSKSLGLKLVKGLAGQLKGVLKTEDNNGAHFFITFKYPLR